MSSLKQTTCPYCGVGCGIDVHVTANTLTGLTGTPEHPANFGRLCVKGSNLLATTGLDGRLLTPEIEGKSASWSAAIDHVASQFNNTIEKYGADSVAFYVSGQLLTEDYYVANKLMKGYIGTANIDTNSRLCMSSAVAAYKRAFGEDIVPCDYRDLEQTDLVILVGSNAAWTHPVLYQRIERAKQLRPQMKVVLLDPRATASCAIADLHLPLAPGSDAFLFNGLFQYLADHNGLDQHYIDNYTQGFSAALAQAQQYSLAQVCAQTQLKEADLIKFYQWFIASSSAISFYSQGINQSSSGTDKNNAIINCHLASGKIGKLGCGPFSITGQPNAMGGREVGGLANTLAAHMDIENPVHRERVQRFWQSPKIAQKPGYKTIELFEKVREGKIKALWIMATNPVVSLPNHQLIQQALEKCEFVVVSDCVTNNDTLNYANVKLPATTWSEKNGTVTNSERRISRQRGLVLPPGQSRHDWQIICDVAKAMGFKQGFNFTHPQQIFCEYAKLTAFENNQERALNLSGLQHLTETEYDHLQPVQWPVTNIEQQRIFADGQFFTPSKKAQFVAISPALPKLPITAAFPFALSSGRIRDQWHTMTRTGKTRILTEHTKRPELQLNPIDAQKLNLHQGDCIRVSNHTGEIVVNLQLDDTMPLGRCFIPIHWSKQFASHANVSQLFATIFDPISGQPELKYAPVKIEKVEINQFVEVYSPVKMDAFCQTLADNHHWTCFQAAEQHGDLWVYQFQNEQLDNSFTTKVKAAIQQQYTKTEQWLSFKGEYKTHTIALAQNQVDVLIYQSNKPINLNHQWLNSLFNQDAVNSEEINALLNGISPEDLGRKVCSCFNVYQKPIEAAILSGEATNVAELGEKLKCGTNCGSCKTELTQMLKTTISTEDSL